MITGCTESMPEIKKKNAAFQRENGNSKLGRASRAMLQIQRGSDGSTFVI